MFVPWWWLNRGAFAALVFAAAMLTAPKGTAQERIGPCERDPRREDPNDRILVAGVVLRCDQTGELTIGQVTGGRVEHTDGDLALSILGDANSFTSTADNALSLSGDFDAITISGTTVLTIGFLSGGAGAIRNVDHMTGSRLSGGLSLDNIDEIDTDSIVVNRITDVAVINGSRIDADEIATFIAVDGATLTTSTLSNGDAVSDSILTVETITNVGLFDQSDVTASTVDSFANIDNSDITARSITTGDTINNSTLRTQSIFNVGELNDVDVTTDEGFALANSFSVALSSLAMTGGAPADLGFTDIGTLLVNNLNGPGANIGNGVDPTSVVTFTDVLVFDVLMSQSRDDAFRFVEGDAVADVFGSSGIIRNNVDGDGFVLSAGTTAFRTGDDPLDFVFGGAFGLAGQTVRLDGAPGRAEADIVRDGDARGDLRIVSPFSVDRQTQNVFLDNLVFDFSQPATQDIQNAGPNGIFLAPEDLLGSRVTVNLGAGVLIQAEDIRRDNDAGGAVVVSGDAAQFGETQVDLTIASDFVLADGREFLIIPGVFLDDVAQNVVTFTEDAALVVEDGALRVNRGNDNQIVFDGAVTDTDRNVGNTSVFAATDGAFAFDSAETTDLTIRGAVAGQNTAISYVNSLGIAVNLADGARVSASDGSALRVVDTNFAPELTTAVDDAAARSVSLTMRTTGDASLDDNSAPELIGGGSGAGALFGPGRDIDIIVDQGLIQGGARAVGIEVTDRDATGAIPTTNRLPFFVDPQPGSFTLSLNGGAIVGGDNGATDTTAVGRQGILLDMTADAVVRIDVGGGSSLIGGVNRSAIDTSAGSSADQVTLSGGTIATGFFTSGPGGERGFIPQAREPLDDFFTPAISLGAGDDFLQITSEDVSIVGGVSLGGVGLFPSQNDDFNAVLDGPREDIFAISVGQRVTPVEGQISAGALEIGAGEVDHFHALRVDVLDVGGSLNLSSRFDDPLRQDVGGAVVSGSLEVFGRGFVAGGVRVAEDGFLRVAANPNAGGEDSLLTAQQGVDVANDGTIFGRGTIDGDLRLDGGRIFLGDDLNATDASGIAEGALDFNVLGDVGFSGASSLVSLFTLTQQDQRATRLNVDGTVRLGGELVLISGPVGASGELEVVRASDGVEDEFDRLRIVTVNADAVTAEARTDANSVVVALTFNGNADPGDDGGGDNGGGDNDGNDDGGLAIEIQGVEDFRDDTDEQELDDIGALNEESASGVADDGEGLFEELQDDEKTPETQPEQTDGETEQGPKTTEITEIIPRTIPNRTFDPEGRVADVVASIRQGRNAINQSVNTLTNFERLLEGSEREAKQAIDRLLVDSLVDIASIIATPEFVDLVDPNTSIATGRMIQAARRVGTAKSAFDAVKVDEESVRDLLFVTADLTGLVKQLRGVNTGKSPLQFQAAIAGLRFVSNLTDLGLAELARGSVQDIVDDLKADITRAEFKQAQIERKLLGQLANELREPLRESAAFVANAETFVQTSRSITNLDLGAFIGFNQSIFATSTSLLFIGRPFSVPTDGNGRAITIDGVTLDAEPDADIQVLMNSIRTLANVSGDVSVQFNRALVRDIRTVEIPIPDQGHDGLSKAIGLTDASEARVAQRLGLTSLGDGTFLFAGVNGGVAFDERGQRDSRTIAFGPTLGFHVRHAGGVIGSYALTYQNAQRRDSAAAQSTDIHSVSLSAAWIGPLTETERYHINLFGGGAFSDVERAGGATDGRWSVSGGGSLGLSTRRSLDEGLTYEVGAKATGRVGYSFASTASDGVSQSASASPYAALSARANIDKDFGDLTLSLGGFAGYELTTPETGVGRAWTGTKLGLKGALSSSTSLEADLSHKFAPQGGLNDISAGLRVVFEF